MKAAGLKTGFIISIFFIILLCPFRLFASGPPVSGLQVTFSSGVDPYGNSRIDVDISWSPWVLMIQCSPNSPPKNALMEYVVTIATSREVKNCISGGVSGGGFLKTNETSYHTSISPDALYFSVSVCAIHILENCQGSTCSPSAEWSHTFSCDYVDLPNMPHDNCTTKLGTAGEPVNVFNGQMYVTHTDFTLPGRGLDLSFTRTYSNRFQIPSQSTLVVSGSKSRGEAKYIERTRVGCLVGGYPFSPLTLDNLSNGIPVGYGWTHSLSQHLDFLLDGKMIKYFDENGTSQYFNQYKNGSTDTFYSPAQSWTTSTLVKNQDDTYTISKEDLHYRFDSSGRLIEISDSYSNQIFLVYDGSGNLTTAIDTLGRQITFQYDANKRLTSIAGPDGTLASYEYSPLGLLTKAIYSDNTNITYQYGDPYDNMNLTKIIDQNGHSYNYTYDNLDRVTEVTRDNSNEKITFSDYNTIKPYYYFYPPDAPVMSAPIQTTTVTNSRGYTTTYSYITKGNGFEGNGLPLMYQISGVGCSSCSEGNQTNIWAPDGNMVSSTDASGMTTKYENYDSRGNPAIIKKAYGTSDEQNESYTYHPVLNRPISVTRRSVLNSGFNKITIFDYDDDYDNIPNENPTFRISRFVEKGLSKNENGETEAYEYVTTYNYNSLGQLLSVDGPRTDVSDVTTFTYYPDDPSYGYNRSRLFQITDPSGNIYAYSNYDIYSNPGQVIDANNVATNYTYDSRGRLKTILIETSLTQIFYDPKGNVDYIILPEGNIVDYTYDVVDRLTGITKISSGSAPIESITYTYDTEGNKTSETIRAGDINGTIKSHSDFEYDQWNKLTKIIPSADSPSKFFKFFNLPNGPVSKEKDGNTTDGLWSAEYIYDSMLRLKQIKNLPANFITGFQYDSQNNLTQITDANGNATNYTYDDMGRLVRTQSPDTGVTSYSYDSAGNLISKTDAKGVTASYTFDSANRLTNIDLPGTNDDIIFSYDSISVSKGKGRLTGMNDASGETLYFYDSLGRITKEERDIDYLSYATNYSYDKNGNLTGTIYPSGIFVHYAYDGADRIAGVTITGNQLNSVINAEYIPFGGFSSIAYGNGALTNISYDKQYRVANLAIGNQLSSLSYQYDNNSNITGITDLLAASKTKTFSYDSLNRLTASTQNTGQYFRNYTYDPVGNRLSETKNNNTTTYTYSANRLTSLTRNPQVETRNFSYDSTGNITSDGEKNFIYNQSNRLARVTENGETKGEYVYDGRGKRILKEIKGNWFVYHYDTNGNIMSVSDRNGNTIADYIYIGNERVGMLLPETETEASGAYKKVASSKGHGSRKLLGKFRGSVRIKNGKAFIKFKKLKHKKSQKVGTGLDPARSVAAEPPLTQVTSHELQAANNPPEISGEQPAANYKTNIEGIISISSNSVSWDSGNKHLSGEVFVTNNDSENTLYNLDVRIKFISNSGVTIYNEDGKVNNKPYWYYGKLEKNGGASAKHWIFSDPDSESFSFSVAVYGDFAPPQEKIFYFHNDHLGTPFLITDENQSVVWSADYEPFGQASIQTNTITNNFRFPGQYYDSETGLYQNGFRDYDPEIGRYIEPDPIGQLGDLNLYSYVGNNPVAYVDPDGLWSSEGHQDATIDPLIIEGVSSIDATIIIFSNVLVDYNPLGQLSGSKHGMPGNEKETLELTNELVRKAARLEAEGERLRSTWLIGETLYTVYHLDSMWTLGKGMHPLQDLYSHAYADAGWRTHYLGWRGIEPSPDDPNLHKDAFQNAIIKTLVYFNRFNSLVDFYRKNKCK